MGWALFFVRLIYVFWILTGMSTLLAQAQSETLMSNVVKNPGVTKKQNSSTLQEKYDIETLVLQKAGDRFHGAVFICFPYCEVLSVKRFDDWVPSLKGIKTYSTNIYLMKKSDPLFPVLFGEDPESEITEEQSLAQEQESLTVPVNEDKKTKKVLIPPETPFNNGVRISLSPRMNSWTIGAEGSVQSGYNSTFDPYALSLGFGYMRGEPLRLLWSWWQFEVGYKLDLWASELSLLDGDTMKNTRNEWNLVAWKWAKTWKWGVKLSQLTEDFKVGHEQLSSFSMEEKTLFLGAALKKGRFRLDLDYGIKVDLSEKQPFRESLESVTVYKAELSFCQSRIPIKYGSFTLCYAANFLRSDNVAGLAPMYGSAPVDMNKNRWGLELTLHYGEDFRR